MLRLTDIHLRDPYILVAKREQAYYLYGTTDEQPWAGDGIGFDCYRGSSLTEWTGPFPVFRPPPGFWGTTQFWAPEVYLHDGRYVMFATFAGRRNFRGTQILVADDPLGPFVPWSQGAVTPKNWQCLDGTLFLDAEGDPWIVFCQEWLQVHDGAMHAQRLSADLSRSIAQPHFLFSASAAPWSRPLRPTDRTRGFPAYVTDGPSIHRTPAGTLLMLWSSHGAGGYAMGIARSESGAILGPWTHERDALTDEDGGHGMILRTLNDELMLVFHQPNDSPRERPVLHTIVAQDDTFTLAPKPR